MERLLPEEKQKLQKLLIELENSENAAEALRRQIDILSASIDEISTTTKTIDGIKDLEQGSEILVPIGSDSFIRAKAIKTNKVLIGLGADVAAEREAGDAIEMLERQKKEFEESISRAREELERLNKRIEELKPRAEQLLAKIRKEE